ncbi:MAG: PAS domain-containing protein [Opitutales bacterium]
MSHFRPIPTGREIVFGDDEIIVSKTDLRGIITYANEVFMRVAGYTEGELLGQPHNLVRHPDMPRCVFKLLWDTIQHGQEIFAYVLNLNKQGDGYWVFAHVTPSYDPSGRMVGYHSNRRMPYADAMPKVRALYAALLAEEKRQANPKDAIQAGMALVQSQLSAAGADYAQFVFSLSEHTRLDGVTA